MEIKRKKVFRNVPKKPDDPYKIKDIIVLSGEGYNIDAWEKMVVEKCIYDNPSFTHVEISDLLGMSTRNLYRICKVYGIDISAKGRDKRFYDMQNEFKQNRKCK